MSYKDTGDGGVTASSVYFCSLASRLLVSAVLTNSRHEVQSLFIYNIGHAHGSHSEKEGTLGIISPKPFTLQVLKLRPREGK